MIDEKTQTYKDSLGQTRDVKTGQVLNSPTPNYGGMPIKGEPSVLSSASGRESFQKDIMPTINKANEAIANVQGEKSKWFTDKTTGEKFYVGDPSINKAMIESRAGKESLPPELQAEADAMKTPEDKLNEAQKKNWDDQKTAAEETFNASSLLLKTNAASQIASLTRQWEERKRQLEKSNKAALGATQRVLDRFGISEYSPMMANDFLSAKEQEGIDKVKELDDEYNAKVSEINSLLESKQFELAARKTGDLLKIEEAAIKAMKDQTKEAKDVNDKLKEKERVQNMEVEIDSLFKQGFETPQEIQSFLKEKNIIASLEEIDDALKIINPDPNLEGVSADLRTFKMFFPETDVSTKEGRKQFLNWEAQVSAANRKPQEDEDSAKPLSILDVQRYNELYPSAGVQAGDTALEADTKVRKSNSPEVKIRDLIIAAKDNGSTYDTVVAEINGDKTIEDKETAIQIAQEVYGESATDLTPSKDNMVNQVTSYLFK